jgi:hypothetical protein
MMTRKVLLPTAVLLLALGSTLVTVVGADGGKAKNVTYAGEGQPRSGSGSSAFSVDTSPIIFYLGTVNNKYHVLLIRVKNNMNAPLNLSKDQDSIELRFSGGQKVKGLLNLPASDPGTWDGLETEIRTAIAYPEVVEPHEEEGIYLYVPVADLKGPRKTHEMPSLIIYNIKSLASPVELRRPGAAKA